MKAKLNKKSVSLNLNLQEFSFLTVVLGQWLEAYDEEDCEMSKFVEKHQEQFEKVDKYIDKCIEKKTTPIVQKIVFNKKYPTIVTDEKTIGKHKFKKVI